MRLSRRRLFVSAGVVGAATVVGTVAPRVRANPDGTNGDSLIQGGPVYGVEPKHGYIEGPGGGPASPFEGYSLFELFEDLAELRAKVSVKVKLAKPGKGLGPVSLPPWMFPEDLPGKPKPKTSVEKSMAAADAMAQLYVDSALLTHDLEARDDYTSIDMPSSRSSFPEGVATDTLENAAEVFIQHMVFGMVAHQATVVAGGRLLGAIDAEDEDWAVAQYAMVRSCHAVAARTRAQVALAYEDYAEALADSSYDDTLVDPDTDAPWFFTDSATVGAVEDILDRAGLTTQEQEDALDLAANESRARESGLISESMQSEVEDLIQQAIDIQGRMSYYAGLVQDCTDCGESDCQ